MRHSKIVCAAAGILALTAGNVCAAPGDKLGEAFQVNDLDSTSRDLYLSALAMDADGDFVVVWNGENGIVPPDPRICARPSFSDLFARRFNAEGAKLGQEFRVSFNDSCNAISARVAMDAQGNFVIVWSAPPPDGNGTKVYARRYAADGTSLGPAFLVHDQAPLSQRAPAVAMDTDGDFIVAWESRDLRQPSDVYARRYDKTGAAGPVFTVNTWLPGEQGRPSVAMAGNGDSLIAWQSGSQAGPELQIYARLYNALGEPLGAEEFRVNAMDTGNFSLNASPTLTAMDAQGNFIVLWEASVRDAYTRGIYARRFTAGGASLDSDTPINTPVPVPQVSLQFQPRVAMDADGRYIITWVSSTKARVGSDIAMKRYHPTGAPEGGERVVKTFADNIQPFPVLVADADGDAVLVWDRQPEKQASPLHNIHAQRFSGNGSTIDLEVVIKDSDDPVGLSSDFFYALLVTNYGTGTALNVQLSATLPSGATYKGATGKNWLCTESAGRLNCALPHLAPGSSSTVEVSLSTAGLAAGTLSASATISAAQAKDANPNNNTDTETTTLSRKAAPAIVDEEPDPGFRGKGGGSAMDWWTVLLAWPLLRRRKERRNQTAH